MTRAALLLALAGAGLTHAANPDPKSLAVPPADAARASELVGHLADREFGGRDIAMKELRKLGRLALPTLLEAQATSTNPEVRLRVELLLPGAVSADYRARVDCFLADTAGKFQHDLPGAKAFFDTVGRTDAAKQLFSDLIRSPNRDLIVTADGPEGDLHQKYLARRQELGFATNGGVIAKPGGGMPSPNTADMAALLFAESRLPDKGTGAGVGVGAVRTTSVLNNYYFQTPLATALTTEGSKQLLTPILDRWMETREQAYSIYQAISFFANRTNLPHALPAARKLAAGKVAGPGSYRGYAIAYVARFGTTDDLAFLEGLHGEKAVLTNVGVGNRVQAIQVRDTALAMGLLVAKQNLADYGLTARNNNANQPDSVKYQYTAYYFDAESPEKTDEKREAAFKKYAEWKEKQKKDKK